MTFGEIYLDASGRAYMQGLDLFDEYMPRDRAHRLIRALAQTRSYTCGRQIADALIMFVARHERRTRKKATAKGCAPDCPLSKKVFCSWRKDPAELDFYGPEMGRSCNSVATSWRLPVMRPTVRCGHRLQDDRLGGQWDDYDPCLFA